MAVDGLDGDEMRQLFSEPDGDQSGTDAQSAAVGAPGGEQLSGPFAEQTATKSQAISSNVEPVLEPGVEVRTARRVISTLSLVRPALLTSNPYVPRSAEGSADGESNTPMGGEVAGGGGLRAGWGRLYSGDYIRSTQGGLSGRTTARHSGELPRVARNSPSSDSQHGGGHTP